jgi:hypothetical protein
MNYAELVQLYFERSNSLQNYWTLYVVVIGGLLAFSSLRPRRDWITTLLVSVLFSFFAFKNLDAIREVTVQRFAVLKSLQHLASDMAANPVHERLGPTLTPPEFGGVRTFHITSDVLTIAALWAMERRRRLLS